MSSETAQSGWYSAIMSYLDFSGLQAKLLDYAPDKAGMAKYGVAFAMGAVSSYYAPTAYAYGKEKIMELTKE
jgi:hypothetical protein